MSKNRRPELKLVDPSADPLASTGTGRVKHDARGNAIWDWAVATGVLAKKSVAELIRSLDVPETMSLEGEPVLHPEQVGDPYNRPAVSSKSLRRR